MVICGVNYAQMTMACMSIVCVIYIIVFIVFTIMYGNSTNFSQTLINRINEPNNTTEQQKTDDVSRVKFHILDVFEPETISFFNSCNTDWKKDVSANKNKASHLGAAYFTREQLEQHDWYNASVTMNDSDVVIVPFQFSSAYNGQCNQSLNEAETNKEIVKAIMSIIEIGKQIKDKAVLFILQSWVWCNHWFARRRIPGYVQLFANLSALDAHIYVGHFENKRDCAWNIESRNNTIVLPYTIPISLMQYEKFNEDKQFSTWKERSHSLFFMGSVCKGHNNNYYDRSVAFKYLHELNKNNVTNAFGVITDPNVNSTNDLCARVGIYNWSKPCSGNMDGEYPCLLMDKEVNKDNKLYIEGMKNSKFNLMINGDSPTSGKFYDSIAFNMINIMVGITKQNKKNYLPFADVIPYEKFLFFIPPKEFQRNGYELLKNIINNTSESVYENMMSNLTFYKKDILWNMKQSMVVKHILREVVNKEVK